MPAGRPTSYTKQLVKAAWGYVNGGWITVGDKVPSVAGLACEIGVHRETLRLWAAEESNEFFGILREIAQLQERELVNNGLTGDFTAPITKMMLTKHGYSDRVETDHTSSDGSMTPKEIIIRAVDVPSDD